MKQELSGSADNANFENHKNHLYLTPLELRRTETPLRRVLIVGSCFADSWLFHHHNAHHVPADYVVHNAAAELSERPPCGDAAEYDLMIVQLGLRFILQDVGWSRVNISDATALADFFNEACARMKTNLDSAMVWAKEYGLPTFVANFFVPQTNSLGRLMPRYSLANPVYFMERLNQALFDLISEYSNAHLLDIDQLSSVFGKRYIQDDALLWNSHGSLWPGYLTDASRVEPMPPLYEHYSLDPNTFRQALWETVIAMYRTLRQIDAVKLVVLDLDDTLWMGNVGELETVGPHLLENWFMGIIEALVYLKQRGVLLAIISKNDEAYIQSVWDKIMAGCLSLEDFATIRINWQSKPENMREILDQLNLLPSHVVFIDDSPVERAAMQAAFPEIRALGRDSYYLRRILLWSAETQVPHISGESGRRTEMIQAQIERDKLRPQLSREEFLASLKLTLAMDDIRSIEHPQFRRALELLNKTNQFNTNGQRWTQADCAGLFSQGGWFSIISAKDKFTDYGAVGVIAIQGDVIAQFVMSCRVVGLDIEVGAVLRLLENLNGRGVSEVRARVVETPANFACRDLYRRCGFILADGAWVASASSQPCSWPAHITSERL